MVPVRAVGAAEPAIVGQYVGPGSCAAQNCHGSIRPGINSKTTALQNEYVTWHNGDRHAKAYDVLKEPRSIAIARRLGMPAAPSASPKCLDCHTTNVPKEVRGAKFGIEDGVTCESCHGPAGGWLARHTQERWTAARPNAVDRLGLVDTTRPEVAARACMGCHYGNAEKVVDHAMLAAGHPPLVFELDTFGANMEVHWKRHAGNEAWFRGGAWAAGQAVALREAAAQLGRQRSATGWPEFSRYDCYACHHDIGRDREGNWTVRGTGGIPQVDGSRWSGVPVLAGVVAPTQDRQVREAIARLEMLVAEGQGAEAAPAASDASVLAESVLRETRAGALDRKEIESVLATLTSPVSGTPTFRDAQQKAWGIDAMVAARAAANGSPADARVGEAIARMFAGLETARGYDPARFRKDVAGVRTALGRL